MRQKEKIYVIIILEEEVISLEVRIEKLDHFGKGIAYIDGKVCFIPGTLPEEVVEIEISKVHKNYLEARVISFVKESYYREIPKCPYYFKCGGCNLAHMSYDFENKWKEDLVKEELKRKFPNEKFFVSDIIFKEEYAYRNKGVFHVKNGQVGYYKENTNELIPIKKCLLCGDGINKMLKEIDKKISGTGEITLKVGNGTKDRMMVLKGVSVEKNSSLLKKDQVISYIGNMKYFVSANSFFQVNIFVTASLYNIILQEIRKSQSKRVLDLYCGTGTIGIFIAGVVEEVIGIEIIKDAISDANRNKKLNNITNISFYCGKVEDYIDKIDYCDAVIVDPPRSGMREKVIKNILRLSPKTIIYVSCNISTMIRDIEGLISKYELVKVFPVNMFPRTYHVECVCVLNRR